MKVEKLKDGLIIVPETEFEELWLRSFGEETNYTFTIFHKHGATNSDYVGLKIVPDLKKE